MIKYIDIKSFGRFNDFFWPRSANRVVDSSAMFSKINILYGRNYSGKTTLSRIIKCLEDKKIPENYPAAEFTIYGDFGQIESSDLEISDLGIRVYNSDFINENLNFLVNQESGEIRTFAIIGAKNNELAKEISNIQSTIDGSATEEGLAKKYEALSVTNAFNLKQRDSKQEDIDSLLRNYANNSIKRDAQLNFVTYNIEHIRADISHINSQKLIKLTDAQVEQKRNLLREQELGKIQLISNFTPAIISLREATFSLVTKKISPSKAIQDLLNDSLLQSWVRDGITLHKDKRNTCAFCRQGLPHDLWDVLGSHFDKVSINLEREIDLLITSIEKEQQSLISISIVEKDKLYHQERALFESLNKEFLEAKERYQADLNSLINLLDQKKKAIFDQPEVQAHHSDPQEIVHCINKLNLLINQNNLKTSTLSGDKENARKELRYDYVLKFSEEIGLHKSREELCNLGEIYKKSNQSLKDLDLLIKSKEEQIRQLRTRQKDERKGAERINQLLNHYFGHDELHMHTIEDEGSIGVKFEIFRGSGKAFNLSEGEKSLVAFCYFIGKLEDLNTADKDPIIYIDDPISSLDTNHIYFIYSLIDNHILKKSKFNQLFISTHNLEFLKYVSKFSISRKEQNKIGKFLVERNVSSSTILKMPEYLQKYATEFIYLFDQIYKCKSINPSSDNLESMYAFGNNLRKFLETYLFFKYPEDISLREKINRFFKNDSTSTSLTNRYVNEYSHLEQIFERGMTPIDSSEIPRITEYVLDSIYHQDPDQFNSFMTSIGEPPR